MTQFLLSLSRSCLKLTVSVALIYFSIRLRYPLIVAFMLVLCLRVWMMPNGKRLLAAFSLVLNGIGWWLAVPLWLYYTRLGEIGYDFGGMATLAEEAGGDLMIGSLLLVLVLDYWKKPATARLSEHPKSASVPVGSVNPDQGHIWPPAPKPPG